MSRMLTNKKYYFIVEATKSCQLSFPARWVYSFLVFRTSVNKPAAEACIFRNLGICNRAVKGYLAELREAGLLAEVNDHYLASEPSEECWQWFVQKRQSAALPWFQRFASYAVYVPNPHQRLPLTHSALLVAGVVTTAWQWTGNDQTIGISDDAVSQTSIVTVPSGKSTEAAKNLRDKGLLDDCWKVTVRGKASPLMA